MRSRWGSPQAVSTRVGTGKPQSEQNAVRRQRACGRDARALGLDACPLGSDQTRQEPANPDADRSQVQDEGPQVSMRRRGSEFKSVSPERAAKNDRKAKPGPLVYFHSSSRDSTLYLLFDTKPPHAQPDQQMGARTNHIVQQRQVVCSGSSSPPAVQPREQAARCSHALPEPRDSGPLAPFFGSFNFGLRDTRKSSCSPPPALL